jgi:hypothetical protein
MLRLMVAGGRRRGVRVASVVLAAALVAPACGGGAPAQPLPVVPQILGFDQTRAFPHDAEGGTTVATADPLFACGSATETYAADVLTNGPSGAAVRYEWGDVVPGLQVYATGHVQGLSFGTTGDLQFTHPFGADMTFNTILDDPYRPLGQVVGKGLSGIPPSSLHTEIAEGLVPHGTDGKYLPGFTPNDNDQVAAYGPWVIDCGHDDFHTEIHPASVLAFAHAEGSTTVSNVFSDPYVVTQLFNPDPAKAADFADTGRTHDPDTLIFPKYLVALILGMLGTGPAAYQGNDRLVSHMIIDPNRSIHDVTWYVCAPGAIPKGGTLSVTSNFTKRSGVELTITKRDDIGCAEITVSQTPAYTPMTLQRKDCELDWNALNVQADLALGRPGLDIRKAIEGIVPASIVPNIERNPVVDCYDPLQAPPVGTSGTTVVNDNQPFPFYGQVSVAWK